MTLNEYQELAMRTAMNTHPYNSTLEYACLGLSGETGEFCDLTKKMLYHGHTYSRAKLIEELGDILWYVAYAAKALDVDLDEVAAINVAKLRHRYPDGFSSQSSINREE